MRECIIFLAGLEESVSPHTAHHTTTPNGTITDQLRQRKTYLDTTEVMAVLRINRATLCRYCRASLIPHIRMPDLSYRFDPVALQGWLSQRTVG